MNKLQNFLKFKVGFPILMSVEKLIGRFSLVGNAAIFNTNDFKWAARLEANWELIRSELESILAFHDQLPNLQDIQKEQYEITSDNKWKVFMLYGFGYKTDLNCKMCPQTTALIEQIPDMTTAFFSILSPNKHIPRHRGVYKGLIRSHLGLIVPGPEGACRMKVDNSLIHWKEGKMLIFDNTCYHEVWNDTDEVRVVLLIDIIRPFPWPISIFNKFIIKMIRLSSYVKEAYRNHRLWEQKVGQRLKQV